MKLGVASSGRKPRSAKLGVTHPKPRSKRAGLARSLKPSVPRRKPAGVAAPRVSRSKLVKKTGRPVKGKVAGWHTAPKNIRSINKIKVRYHCLHRRRLAENTERARQL